MKNLNLVQKYSKDILSVVIILGTDVNGGETVFYFFILNISQLTIIQCSDALCYLAVRICNDIYPSLSSSIALVRSVSRSAMVFSLFPVQSLVSFLRLLSRVVGGLPSLPLRWAEKAKSSAR